MAQFPFLVEVGSTFGEEFLYEEHGFDDGYEQVVRTKLNGRRAIQTVKGRYTRDEFREVQEFLRAHAGGQAMLMVDEASGEPLWVRVRRYSAAWIAQNMVEVTFEVKQVFFP